LLDRRQPTWRGNARRHQRRQRPDDRCEQRGWLRDRGELDAICLLDATVHRLCHSREGQRGHSAVQLCPQPLPRYADTLPLRSTKGTSLEEGTTMALHPKSPVTEKRAECPGVAVAALHD